MEVHEEKVTKLYEKVQESLKGEGLSEADFLAQCDQKAVETMKTVHQKFEDAFTAASEKASALSYEQGVPFKDEVETLRLTCKAMSIKWGVYTLMQRLSTVSDTAQVNSAKASLKILSAKRLSDAKVVPFLPDGLKDSIDEALKAEPSAVVQKPESKSKKRKAESLGAAGAAESAPAQASKQQPGAKRSKGS